MRKLLLAGVLALFMVVIVACGEAAAPTEAPAATEPPAPAATSAPPTSTVAPVEEATEAPPMMEEADDLNTVAAQLAGGPGAIYVGDLNQLIGPVPEPIEDDIGDYDGVPYEGLEDYLYVFDSDYYRMLIERANYVNPTEATTTGMDLSYQLACINRALTHCKIAEWWSDQVYERTNGQLRIEIIGYPELGIAGDDVLNLLENGTLSFAELPSAYTARRPAGHGHEISLGESTRTTKLFIMLR